MFVTLNLIKGPLRRSPCIVTVKPAFSCSPAGLRMVMFPVAPSVVQLWSDARKSSDFGVISNVTGTVAAKAHRVKIVIIGAEVNSTVRSDRWR